MLTISYIYIWNGPKQALWSTTMIWHSKNQDPEHKCYIDIMYDWNKYKTLWFTMVLRDKN